MTRVVRWLGLAVVLAAAAILSFDGLRELALSVSIPVDLAWLLPVVVDAGAAVSCACWLSREVPEDAQLFARALTWSLLGGTVAGNAAQLGMRAEGVTPAWWVAVIVGAVAPAVLGAVVHLAVLVGRGVAQEGVEPSPLTGSALEADASAGSATEPQPASVAAGTDSSPATSEGPVPDQYDADDAGPDRSSMSDAEIVTDAREWAVELRRRPTRDEMLVRYRIGTGRCRTVRESLGWAEPTRPTGPEVEAATST